MFAVILFFIFTYSAACVVRSHSRADTLALGRFSLNIFGIAGTAGASPPLVRALLSVCERVLQATIALPVSIEALESTLYFPRKNYEANRLEAGRLHCAPGTQLLVDETQLTPGQLPPQATANLKCLATLAQQQKLHVDLGQYAEALELDVDAPVCVLSTSKSIIPVRVRLHVVS